MLLTYSRYVTVWSRTVDRSGTASVFVNLLRLGRRKRRRRLVIKIRAPDETLSSPVTIPQRAGEGDVACRPQEDGDGAVLQVPVGSGYKVEGVGFESP